MAQTTKKPAASKPAPKKAPSKKPAQGNGRKASVQAVPPKKPYSRPIGAVICLLLSLFSFIGYANVDAWFVTYFCGFVKSLIGWGYYAFPPALLICSYTLIFVKDRKIGWRICSAVFVPLFLGAICHLFSGWVNPETTQSLIGGLYKSGTLMMSGGVLSGLLAMGLRSAVSVYGAFPVLFFGIIFFTLNCMGLTISRVYRYFRDGHVNRKAAHEAYYDSIPQAPRPLENKTPIKNEAIIGKRGNKAIDIPIDDVNEPRQDYVEEKVGFFNVNPRVKTPDQVLKNGETSAARPEARLDYTPKVTLPTDNAIPVTIEEAAALAGVPVGAAATASQITSAGVSPAVDSVTKKISHDEVISETEEIAKTIEKSMTEASDKYQFPPIALLKAGNGKNTMDGREEIALNRERLESTVRGFGVNATITGVTRGPTVTRYDLELDQGVKLAKLTNLAGDLALSLGVTSVRIAPIPDKISTVGVEVPNKLISTVLLHDIINSANFKTAQSKLSFAIGEDISGNAIVGNIAKLPHMLIAGTTGSGKSVCMNSLILSILYKASPEEVRLIMIDPKMVELGIYNGIPHLFVPVVTDPKKAAGALQWAVVEMLKRYRLFSDAGVRDLTGYNTYQKNQGEITLPRVVIVIDELADLMLVASKEVEESICRVAQMGRASGIHLVIATQRPSADVITGLMKANIPSRIAFAVSSAMESRIILDTSGAEKLIGAGDMLYSPLGVGKPLRVQGAFVSDEEREEIISFVKAGAQVQYSEDILKQIEKAAEDKNAPDDSGKSGSSGFGADYDDLLPQAVDVIFETKQASVSMLQRRLKLGYARAARIVDQMEEIGVVGPFEGSKPRQLLITKQQWQEMQTVQGTAPIEASSDQISFSEYEDTPTEDWKD